jgi:hypothetical protein
MNPRTTLLLLLVAAALAAVLLFTRQQPDRTGSVDQPVLDAYLERATVLRWAFRDQAAIELRREPDGSFGIKEPLADRASRARLAVIANAFDAARMKLCELQDSGEDRQRAGLDPPEATFSATFDDGTTSTVDFGGPSALGGRYLRRNGKIYLGGPGPLEALRSNLDDLRERTVFRTQEPEATRVTVEHVLASGARETLILERQRDEWRLSSPVQARTDRDTMRVFLRVLLGLRIDQFPVGLVRLPTDREPDVRIEVRGARGEERARLWFDQNRALFGQVEGRKVTFVSDDKQYALIFENAASELRSQVLVPMRSPSEELAEFLADLGTEQGRLRLVRDTKDVPFVVAEPILTGKVAPTPVAEMLSGLRNLVVLEFCAGTPEEPRYGFTAASPRIGFRAYGDRDVVWVRFGGDGRVGDQEVRYAQRLDDGAQVVAVPRGAVADLLRPWAFYCSREVLSLSVPVEMLVCERQYLGRTEQGPVYRSTPDGWIRDGDRKPVPLVGEYANDSLRDLRAANTLGARELALGLPDWRLALARANGDQLTWLDVWERGGAPMPLLVQPKGETALVFELSKDASAALRGLRNCE